MFENYVKKILNTKVYDVAVKTPLQPAKNLSKRIKNNVLIKREDMQPIFSFKIRGSYNKLANLCVEDKQKGVITASAGNHAQGIAFAAEKLGIKATIVMPTTTPIIKINAVKAKQVKVILHGDTFAEAATFASELTRKEGYIYAHPYDDPDVIAGQGTIGAELLQQEDDIDMIFVPVGGGGLLAGIVTYIKYLRPDIKVIGVEPENAACLKEALNKSHRVALPKVGLFADGVAVNQIGKETFRLIQPQIDDALTVSADEICAAIKDLFDDTRSIAEPAGALALAGLKKYTASFNLEGKTMVAINSGANTNFHQLKHISERIEINENKEVILSVMIPEKLGSFKSFCSVLGKRRITEFNYRYTNSEYARIFVGIKIDAYEDRPALVKYLCSMGYSVTDLTNNEMAKLHIRYMVGGHSEYIKSEVVYRFEFPEKPCALSDFLSQLGCQWNITMFHYRNHSAAHGRALAGFQVEHKEQKKFANFLDHVGYRHWNETNNEVYRHFLGCWGPSTCFPQAIDRHHQLI